jgi:LAO/AO transport system kinase
MARLITLVENEDPRAFEFLGSIYPHTGRAHVLGITGSPGTGKSTLTDKVTSVLRQQEKTVGVIAVDPSSPFTGGALLGDRIRMQRAFGDPDVFIRSMATRGNLGGLARTTADVIKIMDGFGKDWVIVETVGVGQDEVEIAKTADTTIVVLAPGLGDTIQSMKAGVLSTRRIERVLMHWSPRLESGWSRTPRSKRQPGKLQYSKPWRWRIRERNHC